RVLALDLGGLVDERGQVAAAGARRLAVLLTEHAPPFRSACQGHAARGSHAAKGVEVRCSIAGPTGSIPDSGRLGGRSGGEPHILEAEPHDEEEAQLDRRVVEERQHVRRGQLQGIAAGAHDGEQGHRDETKRVGGGVAWNTSSEPRTTWFEYTPRLWRSILATKSSDSVRVAGIATRTSVTAVTSTAAVARQRASAASRAPVSRPCAQLTTSGIRKRTGKTRASTA